MIICSVSEEMASISDHQGGATLSRNPWYYTRLDINDARSERSTAEELQLQVLVVSTISVLLHPGENHIVPEIQRCFIFRLDCCQFVEKTAQPEGHMI